MSTELLTVPTSTAQEALQTAQDEYASLSARVVALHAEIEGLQRDAEGQSARKTALLKLAYEDGQDISKDRAAVERTLQEIAVAITRKHEEAVYLEELRQAADGRIAAARGQVHLEAVGQYWTDDRKLVEAAESAFRAAEAAWKALIEWRAVEGPRVTGRPFQGTTLQFQAAVGATFDGINLQLPCLVDIHGSLRI